METIEKEEKQPHKHICFYCTLSFDCCANEEVCKYDAIHVCDTCDVPREGIDF